MGGTRAAHAIEIISTSQHVRVEADGVTVAESDRPRVLYEKGFRARYYLRKADVNMDLLEHTDTTSHCPFKGDAEYWSVRAGGELHADVAWSYPTPFPERAAIAGLIAFYDERLDVYVDGERP